MELFEDPKGKINIDFILDMIFQAGSSFTVFVLESVLSKFW